MSRKFYSFFTFTLFSFGIYAQTGNSTQLDELVIEHKKISERSRSQRTIVLNDSLIENSVGTFTDFLQKNTTLYFKENGYGMVSSPSFRGTTAQQTSVLWNGIKINSALLGQTDFNSTAFKSYDDIVVKPGGGSVLYGSGAIGGSIHLNNQLYFDRSLENEIQLNYGSFNTQGLHYKVNAGTSKLAVGAHFGYNKSENDYEWIGKNRKNINGAFFNVDFGTEIAYRINDLNRVEFYSSTFSDDRHFSLITPYQTKTKYQNNYYRNLLKWHYKTSRFLNTFYTANIRESYLYFDQLPKDSKSGGSANTWFFKNESFYNLTSRLKLSSLVEYQRTTGEGENSSLPFSEQEIASVSLMGNYEFSPFHGFEIGLKNEFAKDYENPFLFSAGYYLNAGKYELKINASKNYRIPTFNDLYWQPGGNLNLKPETSYQFDVNNGFISKYLNANLSTYYIDLTDMIRWVPTNSGFWEAHNVDRVSIYGAEVSLGTQKNWDYNKLSTNVNYAYTRSLNDENNKQLTYTPLHKLNLWISYQYKGFSIVPSLLYNGKIYTTASNDEDSIVDAYAVMDLDIGQQFRFHKFPFTVNLKIKNVANTAYTNMPERMMPGRNYHLQIIKKF